MRRPIARTLPLITALLLAPLAANGESPVITWVSDPVRPDETVLLRHSGQNI